MLIETIRPAAILTLAALIAASSTGQAKPAPAEHHASGSFEVQMQPESETRYAMTKTFSGGMTGTSRGTMIGDSAVDAYAALERFEGTVDGRSGSFVLLHRGYMSAAEGMNLDIVIAPNSGTGQLAGIRGKLTIRIEGAAHSYDLTYSLASSR